MQTFNSFLALAIFAIVLMASPTANAQRPVLSDEEEVAEAVTNEISAVFQSEDFLKKKNKKFADVHGYMVIDIGIVQKGKVSTFFKVDSDIKNIGFINFMSDYILTHKFAFKLPKQQRYKVRYNATF